MEKDHRSLSSEDTQWIVYKLPAFALGAIGPFIVYGVHCILPWWIEVLYIWFDVGMRANFIDNALYDWRFPKFVIWIHRLFWAVLEIYLRVYVDATYRLLVHQWISYYLVGMLQQFLLYLDCDGPTRVEEAAIQLGREASIVYVLVLYVVATVDRLILLLTARWIFFLAVFYLTARTTAKWLGYKLSILSRFWDRVRALTMPSAFRWALYHFSEARINRWFHMFALELSRREQEREEKRREGTPRFQHRPLAKGEIRLLVLQPKPKFLAATIEAHIEHHTLEAAPAYEALSYCWGNSELTDRILIDGKAFPVTASAIDLLVACRRFTRRLRNQHRRVWIDAICIDQSNDVEKSSQIQRMRDIYQRATRVIAYPAETLTLPQRESPSRRCTSKLMPSRTRMEYHLCQSENSTILYSPPNGRSSQCFSEANIFAEPGLFRRSLPGKMCNYSWAVSTYLGTPSTRLRNGTCTPSARCLFRTTGIVSLSCPNAL